MIKTKISIFSLICASLTIGGLTFAGEPAGIGEQGTGQTQKSTEREQSQNKPDLSQVPQELREGKSAQAAQELNQGQEANRQFSQEEPAGIGEKGTGQTKKSTERQQSQNKPDMSQVPQELREGKTARAAEELEQGTKK